MEKIQFQQMNSTPCDIFFFSTDGFVAMILRNCIPVTKLFGITGLNSLQLNILALHHVSSVTVFWSMCGFKSIFKMRHFCVAGVFRGNKAQVEEYQNLLDPIIFQSYEGG